jgi:riboflavin kinase/FMN adenylyltransferase
VKLVRRLSQLDDSLRGGQLRGGAVAIGNFDGVHWGHARIVERLVESARRSGGPAIVFTFDPHPVRLLRPNDAPPPLTWTDRKAELLGALGVDAMIAYPTDEALLKLAAEEFFQKIVVDALAAKAMVEGPNFRFGRNRTGTIESLEKLCNSAGVSLEIVAPIERDGDYISSSRIRRLIADGAVGQARTMLTEPYRIRGMVAHGAGRGVTIGFPTANLEAIDTLLPADGVYAARARTSGGRMNGDGATFYPAAVNVGPNPTFGEHAKKVEAHLIGFEGSLYGEPLELDFLTRLREITRFAGIEELKEQLNRDVEAARRENDQCTNPNDQ